MTVIVTGGAGFIGSNFIFYMLKKYPSYRIICLDKLTYAGNLSTLAPVMDSANFRFVKADICDREAVYKLFEEEHPETVVRQEHRESGYFFADEYNGYFGSDGRIPKIRNKAFSSGFHR